jgi:hypothetical protein
MPAAARVAPASRSKHTSHGLPVILVRRIRRIKPRGNRIRAANISGSTPPAGLFRREAVVVPAVPTVSVVVSGALEGAVKLVGAKLQVTLDGSVPQEKFTVPVNPPVGASVITVLPVEPLLMVSDDGVALSV